MEASQHTETGRATAIWVKNTRLTNKIYILTADSPQINSPAGFNRAGADLRRQIPGRPQ